VEENELVSMHEGTQAKKQCNQIHNGIRVYTNQDNGKIRIFFQIKRNLAYS
jgi:hypothetical protein